MGAENEKAPANAEALRWLLVMASLLSRTYRKVTRKIRMRTGDVKQPRAETQEPHRSRQLLLSKAGAPSPPQTSIVETHP